jgi:hypothetical protein
MDAPQSVAISLLTQTSMDAQYQGRWSQNRNYLIEMTNGIKGELDVDDLALENCQNDLPRPALHSKLTARPEPC